MTLPELAIRRPITTLVILVSLMVLGVVALTRLPLAFLPDVEEPRLFVRAPYPNASPEQVERSVVRPLEEALGSVKGLEGMWSSCDQNGGMVQLRYNWGMDMRLARIEVREKVDRIRFGPGACPCPSCIGAGPCLRSDRNSTTSPPAP